MPSKLQPMISNVDDRRKGTVLPHGHPKHAGHHFAIDSKNNSIESGEYAASPRHSNAPSASKGLV